MHMPMFSKVWKTTVEATPKQTSMDIVLPERRPICTQRMTIIMSSRMTRQAPMRPSSSPTTAKMKSVCLPGMALDWLWVPSPRPVPVSPPEAMAILAWCGCQLMPWLVGSMLGS